ncbi:nuclease-related domain-containing protein [Thioalkalivibrio sp. AKL12]|uniref:nuclease-related domain-containing protein n=1 Tax=Thioalkalivibrio sp. AKL12 TaxID=1158159 RepID=UPI000363E82B|nr:nuclease-related domain-containing protein [Thioalkalivibrio sp. AKL12]
MILKEKDGPSGQDERSKAGHQQEQDVAFYLRREFGDDEAVRIINDLRIEHNGERAQIDHLVVHPYGLVVIESKSIYGEVKVNGHGEWSRSYRGDWYGMPSPVRQAELQEALVKDLLRENVEKFLGRLLGLQTQIGGRDWRTLCAVSSSAILHRDEMPRAIANRVVKSEFVAEKVRELVGSRAKGLVTARPRFSQKEIEGIGDFLLQSHLRPSANTSAVAEPAPRVQEPPVSDNPEPAPKAQRAPTPEPQSAQAGPSPATSPSQASTLACKKCGEQDKLTGMYGKYGYYVRCDSCGTNTSMKVPCPACQSRKVRVTKSGPTYTSACQDCSHEWVVFEQRGSSTEQ